MSMAMGTSTVDSITGTGMAEGWRAVLTVVLRTGFTRRQRMRSLNLRSAGPGAGTGAGVGSEGTEGQEGQDVDPDAEDPDRMEVDGIHAMVEGVKAHGVSIMDL